MPADARQQETERGFFSPPAGRRQPPLLLEPLLLLILRFFCFPNLITYSPARGRDGAPWKNSMRRSRKNNESNRKSSQRDPGLKMELPNFQLRYQTLKANHGQSVFHENINKSKHG
ncbi:hypothetical protein EVAR_96525_1 [Eumeta japonica]|uniref:Uncharacterized protein n=1 Tax=Eumeta variegata TaxID=151549 RepID=A0A4C1WCV3_EUMVA|nr:hypothetical protein EVAR_96525_1 [Eumeta japonica]